MKTLFVENKVDHHVQQCRKIYFNLIIVEKPVFLYLTTNNYLIDHNYWFA